MQRTAANNAFERGDSRKTAAPVSTCTPAASALVPIAPCTAGPLPPAKRMLPAAALSWSTVAWKSRSAHRIDPSDQRSSTAAWNGAADPSNRSIPQPSQSRHIPLGSGRPTLTGSTPRAAGEGGLRDEKVGGPRDRNVGRMRHENPMTARDVYGAGSLTIFMFFGAAGGAPGSHSDAPRSLAGPAGRPRPSQSFGTRGSGRALSMTLVADARSLRSAPDGLTNSSGLADVSLPRTSATPRSRPAIARSVRL